MLVASTVAFAQPQDNDYYAARQTSYGVHLLGVVEGHHLEQGLTKMRAGNYYFAHGDFEFILRYFPNHPRALAHMSELCDLRWKDARCDVEEWFRKAVAINARAPQTFLAYGVHLQRSNRPQDAIEAYKRAIELDPLQGNAHYNLGLIYLEKKQYDAANRHAQLAYALAMPFPALRDKLMQAGQWRPMEAAELKRELSPTGKTPDAAPPK